MNRSLIDKRRWEMIDEEILSELEIIKTELELLVSRLGKIVIQVLDEKYKNITEQGGENGKE